MCRLAQLLACFFSTRDVGAPETCMTESKWGAISKERLQLMSSTQNHQHLVDIFVEDVVSYEAIERKCLEFKCVM